MNRTKALLCLSICNFTVSSRNPSFNTKILLFTKSFINCFEDGNFLDASKVSKEDAMTIIPMTEKSGSRTSSTVAPHPLCDNLKYVAGDYEIYVKDKSEDVLKYYNSYMSELEKWHLSEYAHNKADAVYRYIGIMVIASSLLTFDASKKFPSSSIVTSICALAVV